MAPYGRELLARLAAEGRTVVLMIDQTRATARHQVVMVAARVGGRALPLAWRVRTTPGAIGFDEQRGALEAVAGLLPAGARPVLMGDRFYGTPALIGWCRQRGWGWRLRLKRDLPVFEGGGETTPAACLARGERLLRDVELTERRAVPTSRWCTSRATSTGMWDAVHRATPDEKKPRHSSPATCCAA